MENVEHSAEPYCPVLDSLSYPGSDSLS